ncbi:hypothetical protein M0R04_04460 [Candidatus Dojkabacteria bacterium]|jgi:hypothetical protein|nr:hypothetical protein [Candidatus Dojkabacteria bacterium]
MEFYVKFETGSRERDLLDKIGTPGIDILDLFREWYPQYNSFSCKDISFRDQCPYDGHSMKVEISEDLARESNLFKGRTSISVIVGDFFSKYVDMKVKENIRERYIHKKILGLSYSCKEVKYLASIEVFNEFDIESMLNDWKDAGFPIEWKL